MASDAAKRRAQNRGVKAGTVRIGAKGKTVRRYNAKTGRWDVTKSNVKPGVALAKPGTRSTTTPKSTTTKRGGYTGGITSYTPTKTKTTSGNKTYSKTYTKKEKGAEAPRVSRTTNYTNWGFRTPGSNKSTDKIITNKPSDFKKNGANPPLQLVKQRRKDSKGRDVYRWVEVKSYKK